VARNDDSFMRALVMDFPQDRKVWDMNSEYLFGRALLAVPVTRPLYTEEKIVRTNELSGWDKNQSQGEQRGGYPAVDWAQKHSYEAYLPAGSAWYDFWTGQRYDGGQTVKTTVPLDHSPLYVRAGSILPLGPDVHYASERPWDDLELIVYPGADGTFTLYEDEGDGFNYERGLYTEIPITWNNRSRTLTIQRRVGNFPGMLTSRHFRIHTPDGAVRTVTYTGAKTSVKL
jgi:alpha-D-xyloside xylohydrolase